MKMKSSIPDYRVIVPEELVDYICDILQAHQDFSMRWNDKGVCSAYQWDVRHNTMYRLPNTLTQPDTEIVNTLILLPTYEARMQYMKSVWEES